MAEQIAEVLLLVPPTDAMAYVEGLIANGNSSLPKAEERVRKLLLRAPNSPEVDFGTAMEHIRDLGRLAAGIAGAEEAWNNLYESNGNVWKALYLAQYTFDTKLSYELEEYPDGTTEYDALHPRLGVSGVALDIAGRMVHYPHTIHEPTDLRSFIT